MNYKITESIKNTKQGFEESFETETFYNNQTQDEKHLELILDYLNVKAGTKILDLVISRYSLHHFPEINYIFQEVSRVLKPEGRFFLSDPASNENDTSRFVDTYMRMKKDGHIKFYTQKEWKELGKSAGLNYIDGFETSIRFPRKRETALEFDDIISRFDSEVINSYNIEIIDDEIWITEKVNNLLFQKY